MSRVIDYLMFAAWLVCIFCMVFFASLSMSGCAATEQLLNIEQLRSQPAASDASTAPDAAPPAGITPAPAGMSRAEQKRYYAAQLTQQKQAVPRKQKNSNNITQEVHNGPSLTVICIMLGAAFCCGALAMLLVTLAVARFRG